MKMVEKFRWMGIAFQLIGVALIATNIVNPIFGFATFLFSQSILIPICIIKKDWAHLLLFMGFMLLDIVGIIRWWS